MQVNREDTIRNILERGSGKRAQLMLNTGESLEGMLTLVGDQVVQLSQLVGREFYEAIIRVDSISAVVVRSDRK